MFKATHYRLDWRSEFKKLSPYINGKGGVVLIEYESENAAPDKFNHLLKEDFFITPTNCMWISLRIDHDWFTTRQVDGILDELERLLSKAGFPVEKTDDEQPTYKIVTDNDVEGSMYVTIRDNVFGAGNLSSVQACRARLRNICETVRKYVGSGGRLMIVVNDTPISDQTPFWQQVWNAGLAEAGGDNLLLVIHSGPKAGRQRHPDSPDAHEHLFLPDTVEGDETRQDHIYDDLVDIFKDAGIEDAHGCAVVYLESNASSVLNLHAKVGGMLMAVKRRLKDPGK